MKRALLIPLLLASSVFAAQSDRKPDKIVDRQYESPEGAVIKGLGACSVSADDIVCWDMDGKADPRLTELVRAQFLVRESTLQLVFRKKNRILVVTKHGASSVQLSSSMRGGNYSSWSSPNGEETQLIGVASPPDQTTISVLADFYQVGPAKKSRFELKKGTQNLGEGQTLEFVDALKIEMPPNMGRSSFMMGSGPAWRIRVAGSGVESLRSSQAIPIGRDGKVISYVDRKGKPVSTAEYLRANPNRSAYPTDFGDRSNAKYLPVQIMTEYGYGPGALSWTSNVDPAFITALDTSRFDRRLVEITGFPLDPKG